MCPCGAVLSEWQWMFLGCQSPPVKSLAPAFRSSAALCAQHNGVELFVCHELQGRSTARAAGDNDSQVLGTATPWRHYPTKAVGAAGGMQWHSLSSQPFCLWRALVPLSSWLPAPGSTRFPWLHWHHSQQCRQKPGLWLHLSKLPPHLSELAS